MEEEAAKAIDVNGSMMEVKQPTIVYENLVYENISSAASSESCTSPKGERKKMQYGQ